MTDTSEQIEQKGLRALQLVAFLRRHAVLLKRIVAIAFGLTVLVLAVIPLLPDATELSYIVARNALLTEVPEAEGLVGEYYFEDLRIEQLWQLEIRVVNTGNRTLVGQGQIANVLGSGLAAEVPAQFRILRADMYRNDPVASVVLDGEQGLVLSFAQWQSGEVVELVLYVEAILLTTTAEPELTFAERQLVDGRVIRGPTTGDDQLRRTTLLDSSGGASAAAVRVIGSAILGLLAVVSGTTLFLFCKDFSTGASAATEVAEYSNAVSKWLSEHPELDEDIQERLQAATGRLPGRMMLAGLTAIEPTITTEMIDSFPRLSNEPMFSTHRNRIVGVLLAAAFCALFILLAVDLALAV